MMGTMPTQRKSKVTKAKCKKKKKKENHTVLANILLRSAKDATSKQFKIEKTITIQTLHKILLLDIIRLTQDKLERAINPICIMTTDKKPKFKLKLF